MIDFVNLQRMEHEQSREEQKLFNTSTPWKDEPVLTPETDEKRNSEAHIHGLLTTTSILQAGGKFCCSCGFDTNHG